MSDTGVSNDRDKDMVVAEPVDAHGKNIDEKNRQLEIARATIKDLTGELFELKKVEQNKIASTKKRLKPGALGSFGSSIKISTG